MWDGRETVKGQAIRSDLVTQASTRRPATRRAPRRPLAQLQAIVDFELGAVHRADTDHGAGSLHGQRRARRSADAATQPFCIGINDPLNILPVMPGACATSSGGLDPNVFTLFGAWEHADSPERQAIARGEKLFNTRSFVIDNVAGLNGAPGRSRGRADAGRHLHDLPRHAERRQSLDLDAAEYGSHDAALRTPDLPLYTLENKTTHETVKTTDPAGQW